jgi:hypothetical protein
MSGKTHPAKPISQATGPTYTVNDPAKFGNKGKSSGKIKPKGVETDDSMGALRPNSTHIPTMNADKPAPESKVKTTKSWFDPHSTNKTAGVNDSPVHTGAASRLKSEYNK